MLALRQIQSHLEANYFKFVVLREDEQRRSDAEKQDLLFTRSLVAFYLDKICGCPEEKISKRITDGFGDNGIDGVYFDPLEKTLHLVQSKLIKNGNDGIDLGDVNKFISGVKDIIAPKFDRFNKEINDLGKEINACLLDANTRVMISIVTTTQQKVSTESQRIIDDLLSEQNSVHAFMNFEYYGIRMLHDLLKRGSLDTPINAEILVSNWSEIQSPVKSITGMISGSDLAALVEVNGKRLFAPNIRYFLGKTEVNEAISDTARKSPDLFWYFNNGVTAICRSIRKKPVGGTSRSTGIFECESIYIINGAQTVGALFEAGKTGADLSTTLVSFRVIEVAQGNDEFGLSVTKNNNTQNRVDSRDFVSLEKNQERIYEEMLIENVVYAYKSGDVLPDGIDGFTFEEAAISYACQKNDVPLMVLAKSGVSKLWASTDKPPYTLLFNGATEGPKLWIQVKIMRKVESWINKTSRTLSNSRDRLVIVHGNRFLLMVVYSRLPGPSTGWIVIPDDQIDQICQESFHLLKDAIQDSYPDAQLGTLFKNPSKCKDIKIKIDSNVGSPISLFNPASA